MNKVPSTPFSDFIRNATEDEKAEVYGKVMEEVAREQRAIMDYVLVKRAKVLAGLAGVDALNVK